MAILWQNLPPPIRLLQTFQLATWICQMLPLGFFSACLIDLSPIRCCHTDSSQTSNLNIFVLFILASLTAEVELTRNKEEIDFTVNLMIFRIQQIQIYGHLACCQKTFVSSTLKSTSRLYPRKSIWIGFGWGTIPFEQLKQVVTCISPRFIHIQGDFLDALASLGSMLESQSASH